MPGSEFLSSPGLCPDLRLDAKRRQFSIKSRDISAGLNDRLLFTDPRDLSIYEVLFSYASQNFGESSPGSFRSQVNELIMFFRHTVWPEEAVAAVTQNNFQEVRSLIGMSYLLESCLWRIEIQIAFKREVQRQIHETFQCHQKIIRSSLAASLEWKSVKEQLLNSLGEKRQIMDEHGFNQETVVALNHFLTNLYEDLLNGVGSLEEYSDRLSQYSSVNYSELDSALKLYQSCLPRFDYEHYKNRLGNRKFTELGHRYKDFEDYDPHALRETEFIGNDKSLGFQDYAPYFNPNVNPDQLLEAAVKNKNYVIALLLVARGATLREKHKISLMKDPDAQCLLDCISQREQFSRCSKQSSQLMLTNFVGYSCLLEKQILLYVEHQEKLYQQACKESDALETLLLELQKLENTKNRNQTQESRYQYLCTKLQSYELSMGISFARGQVVPPDVACLQDVIHGKAKLPPQHNILFLGDIREKGRNLATRIMQVSSLLSRHPYADIFNLECALNQENIFSGEVGEVYKSALRAYFNKVGIGRVKKLFKSRVLHQFKKLLINWKEAIDSADMNEYGNLRKYSYAFDKLITGKYPCAETFKRKMEKVQEIKKQASLDLKHFQFLLNIYLTYPAPMVQLIEAIDQFINVDFNQARTSPVKISLSKFIQDMCDLFPLDFPEEVALPESTVQPQVFISKQVTPVPYQTKSDIAAQKMLYPENDSVHTSLFQPPNAREVLERRECVEYHKLDLPSPFKTGMNRDQTTQSIRAYYGSFYEKVCKVVPMQSEELSNFLRRIERYKFYFFDWDMPLSDLDKAKKAIAQLANCPASTYHHPLITIAGCDQLHAFVTNYLDQKVSSKKPWTIKELLAELEPYTGQCLKNVRVSKADAKQTESKLLFKNFRLLEKSFMLAERAINELLGLEFYSEQAIIAFINRIFSEDRLLESVLTRAHMGQLIFGKNPIEALKQVSQVIEEQESFFNVIDQLGRHLSDATLTQEVLDEAVKSLKQIGLFQLTADSNQLMKLCVLAQTSWHVTPPMEALDSKSLENSLVRELTSKVTVLASSHCRKDSLAGSSDDDLDPTSQEEASFNDRSDGGSSASPETLTALFTTVREPFNRFSGPDSSSPDSSSPDSSSPDASAYTSS